MGMKHYEGEDRTAGPLSAYSYQERQMVESKKERRVKEAVCALVNSEGVSSHSAKRMVAMYDLGEEVEELSLMETFSACWSDKEDLADLIERWAYESRPEPFNGGWVDGENNPTREEELAFLEDVCVLRGVASGLTRDGILRFISLSKNPDLAVLMLRRTGALERVGMARSEAKLYQSIREIQLGAEDLASACSSRFLWDGVVICSAEERAQARQEIESGVKPAPPTFAHCVVTGLDRAKKKYLHSRWPEWLKEMQDECSFLESLTHLNALDAPTRDDDGEN